MCRNRQRGMFCFDYFPCAKTILEMLCDDSWLERGGRGGVLDIMHGRSRMPIGGERVTNQETTTCGSYMRILYRSPYTWLRKIDWGRKCTPHGGVLRSA